MAAPDQNQSWGLGVGASVAAVALAAAGVVHLRLGPTHFDEDPLYGVFFYVAGVLQLLGAISIGAALVRGRALSSKRWWFNFACNGGIVVVWAVTRTAGPLIGAEAGRREAVGFPDVLAVGLEIVAMSALVFVARAPARVGPGLRRAPAAIATAVVALIAVPLVIAAEPIAHSEFCEAHEEGPYEGPLASVYGGHVMIEPPLPAVQASVGQSQVALVGKFVNCAEAPVVVSSAETIGYQDPVPAEGPAARILAWSVGRLDGSDLRDLSRGGATVPRTGDDPELGLFMTVAPERPGIFRIHNVAVGVSDEDQQVKQTFATIVSVEVNEPP